jgi:diadenosine tetraphosphate (Ap4A) HIT family hydrolase
MPNCCDIWEVFEENKNLIKEYKYWKLVIRKNHTKLGSCVAITKRHMERFSDVTADEIGEFAILVKEVENSLKAVFNYDKINYLMLMMKDKHAHFHIMPRYDSHRNFAGIEWVDEGGPDPLVQVKEFVGQETLNKIKDEIENNIAI